MSLQSPFARKTVAAFSLGFFLVLPATLFAQTNYYATNGSEYAITGQLPGDQVYPDVALGSGGGFVVWQDNTTANGAWAISAARVDSTLSATTWLDERVNNTQDTNDEENARVALLKDGGAVFVWQGGVEGVNQHIYAQFLSSSNTFLTTTDILVSTFAAPGSFQVNPAVAVLNNSNVVVAWSSLNQAGSNTLLDVYAKILSPTGLTISNEFLVNQFTNFNQRTPAITALAGGGFVIAWVSEQERQALNTLDNSILVTSGAGSVSSNENLLATNYSDYTSAPEVASVDIYARLFQSSGAPVGPEFLVNSNTDTCANPAIAAAPDGSFMVAWSDMDPFQPTNGWDVYARTFSSTGVGGTMLRVNTYLPGNQFAPRLGVIGLDYLVVWSSIGQNNLPQGVYGQFVHSDGTRVGGEFQVNTTETGPQLQPTVASDGVSQFLVVWSAYTGGASGVDLYAQRYVNVADVLFPMSAPNVWAPFTLSNNVYQPQLVVSWPPLQGISVSNFQVYVDGASSPMGITTSNCWVMTAANGLTADSTHSFAVSYVTTAGGQSPLSPPASGTTWQSCDYYGIPCQWIEQYYGDNIGSWPSATAPIAPGGPTLLQVFMTGGDPTNSATWLTTSLVQSQQGIYLFWNTQPGLTYQVQQTANFASWSNVGTPRYAAGTNDSIYVGGNAAGFYRVQCLTQ